MNRYDVDIHLHRHYDGRKSHLGPWYAESVRRLGTILTPVTYPAGDFPIVSGTVVITGNMTVTPVTASLQQSYPYTTSPAPTVAPGTIGEDECLQCQSPIISFEPGSASDSQVDYTVQPG